MGNAAVHLSHDELRIEVLEGRDAFVQLERAWNDAVANGPHDEPMLRHEWLRAYIDNFARGATLRTLVARAGRELCAALPLIETVERSADTCFIPMVTWSLPVNDHSQRGGALLGRRGQEGLELIWKALDGNPRWERLRFRELPEGAPEWKLLDWAHAAGMPCGLWRSLRSPYLPLPSRSSVPPAGGKKGAAAAPVVDVRYETLEAALDAKFRQNLRRRKRRLAERGEVRYQLVDGKDAKQLDDALADFFDIEVRGWKGRRGTAIAQHPDLVGFYTQVARDAARRGALALGILTLSGKPIAAHFSLLNAGRHYLIKLAYDETLSEFSPGQQLVSEAIADSCRRDLTEFDFLGPAMPWKLDWEAKLRDHTWLIIFRPSVKGRLVHAARYTLWPLARALLKRGK